MKTLSKFAIVILATSIACSGPPPSTSMKGCGSHSVSLAIPDGLVNCQGKVEMSPSWQSRNVPFCPALCEVHVILPVPVKRRRALVATNPIEE